ncbi:hypothetical protein CXG81DRAFT_21229 [Caulochytrium protostelioides]|nr:hypothetical protein CXG81DRAFT_21229 [Caulochytrium protostelioides]|eukprot:RKO98554.1 hypothetical protein CXG81DRAFT_21229 [Caulochytrium protostelioides]
MQATPAVGPLYRGFLRAQRRWPQQPGRQVRVDRALLDRVRAAFREPLGPGQTEAARRHDGQQQLEAITAMLDNALVSKYPSLTLDEPTSVRAFLPADAAYMMLDTEVNEVIRKASKLDMIKVYFAKKLHLKSAPSGKEV